MLITLEFNRVKQFPTVFNVKIELKCRQIRNSFFLSKKTKWGLFLVSKEKGLKLDNWCSVRNEITMTNTFTRFTPKPQIVKKKYKSYKSCHPQY